MVKNSIENPVEHDGIFRTEEAVSYLKLPSHRSFNRLRREYHINGVRVGHEYLYSKEQLEHLRQCMFGMDLPTKKANSGK